MLERWRSIPGFPDYEVSDQGQVRSLPRVVTACNGRARRIKGGVLKSTSVPGKYSTVVLRLESRSSHTIAVHTAVLRAFVGPPLKGQEGAHGDGDMRNNRLVNLRWAYPKQNHADRLEQGRPMAHTLNLTPDQVREIRRRVRFGAKGNKDGMSGNVTALAAEYGVNRLCIFRAAKGRSYAWVA